MIFNPYSQTRMRAGPALPNGIRPRTALFCFWWHRAISRWKLISHCLIYARFPRHCHWRAGFRLPGAGMAWCAINFHCHFPLRFAPPTGYRLGHGRMKSWVEWRVDRVGNSFHNRTQPFPTGWKRAAVEGSWAGDGWAKIIVPHRCTWFQYHCWHFDKHLWERRLGRGEHYQQNLYGSRNSWEICSTLIVMALCDKLSLPISYFRKCLRIGSLKLFIGWMGTIFCHRSGERKYAQNMPPKSNVVTAAVGCIFKVSPLELWSTINFY